MICEFSSEASNVVTRLSRAVRLVVRRDRGEVRRRSAGGQRGGWGEDTDRAWCGVARVVQLLYAVRYTLALFQSMEQ